MSFISYEIARYNANNEMPSAIVNEVGADPARVAVRRAVRDMLLVSDMDSIVERFTALNDQIGALDFRISDTVDSGSWGFFLDPAKTHPSEKPARVIVTARRVAE